MRNFRLVLYVSLVLFSVARPCQGTEIAYAFQGTVTTGGTLFGQSIATGSMSGHFAYDTSSVGVPLTASILRYTQHRTGGLVAIFTGTQIPPKITQLKANDYFIDVNNNRVVGVNTYDEFEIRFQGGQFASALLVDNTPQSLLNGLLLVALRFNSTAFASTSPLVSLSSGNLVPMAQAKSSLANDSLSGIGAPDAVFRVNSFSVTTLPPEVTVAVPEPGSGALAIVALAGILEWLRLNGRRHKR